MGASRSLARGTRGARGTRRVATRGAGATHRARQREDVISRRARPSTDASGPRLLDGERVCRLLGTTRSSSGFARLIGEIRVPSTAVSCQMWRTDPRVWGGADRAVGASTRARAPRRRPASREGRAPRWGAAAALPRAPRAPLRRRREPAEDALYVPPRDGWQDGAFVPFARTPRIRPRRVPARAPGRIARFISSADHPRRPPRSPPDPGSRTHSHPGSPRRVAVPRAQRSSSPACCFIPSQVPRASMPIHTRTIMEATALPHECEHLRRSHARFLHLRRRRRLHPACRRRHRRVEGRHGTLTLPPTSPAASSTTPSSPR